MSTQKTGAARISANSVFSNAAVIGTGQMGPGIAVTLALGGIPTVILSRSAEGAAKGLESARKQSEFLQRNGLPSPTLELISASADMYGVVKNCQLVIESGPEKMEFKQDLFAHLETVAPPDAVLATNTSGLSITVIASKCQRPERVITTHFWNPPHLMPLVEIVKGEKTDDAIAEQMRDLIRHCGKTPVVVKKDRPGQLGNRLQMALLREAVNIVAEGIADVEDVDLAAKTGFGLRLPVYGIFEHQDNVGLDLGFAVLDYVSRDLYSEPHAPELYRDKVLNGTLGVKTGTGFYDWSKKSIEEVRARRDQFVVEFCRDWMSRE